MTIPTPNPHTSTGDKDPVRWSFDRLRIDHTHGRYHHRVARAVSARLPKVLDAEEKMLGFTEAIEDSDFPTRVFMGFGWPFWRRVALLFTNRRLVEIGLSCCGRRAFGRVRSFPWDKIPGFETKGTRLEVATWQEARHRWRLRERLDGGLERALRRQVDLAVSTYQPSQGLTVPIRQCGHCGTAVPAPRDTCGHCDRRVRSSRLAGILALAFPGAGHGYTGRWGAATLRLVIEGAVFGWVGSRILSASTPTEAITPVVAGAVSLLIVKLQGSAVARRLARRAELVRPTTERRWRWSAGIGVVVSLTALVLPFALVGETDNDISWDLDFVATHSGWTRRPASSPANTRDATMRSHWFHRDGLRAEVRAWPLRPFEPPANALNRFASQHHGDSVVLVLGPHRVVTSKSEGDLHTTLRYAIVDEQGRDLHVVSSTVPSEAAVNAALQVERLISCGIWVPATRSRGNGG